MGRRCGKGTADSDLLRYVPCQATAPRGAVELLI
jgi:hypothetical protein